MKKNAGAAADPKVRVGELQRRTQDARKRAEAAKKDAQDAKRRAREARRLFKEAKKIAKKARNELTALSKKLKKLIDDVPRTNGASAKSVAKAKQKKRRAAAQPAA